MTHSVFLRVNSVLAYAVSSILAVFINKILLTNYRVYLFLKHFFRFPSFLFTAIGQIITTIVVLFFSSSIRIFDISPYNSSVIYTIFPLPVFYGLNLVFGLGGTQMINVPMFTVLRRFSIIMTMVLEYVILRVSPNMVTRSAVFLMIAGSIIAALYDLTFDMYGYSLVLLNDICTALNSVYLKKKLEAKELGKYSLMYYNALFIVIPISLLLLLTDDLQKVNNFIVYGDLSLAVTIFFLLSCICGFILNYSIVLCTHYNSPLTTACVGPIKNIIVTYIGMFSSGDYIFTWNNFIGINISTLGSIIYAAAIFRSKNASILSDSNKSNSAKGAGVEI